MSKLALEKIVDACFKLYNQIPNSGKPIENEWTVLSCIVKYNTGNEDIEVVSLGTGSKCIGATKMSPIGDILNDSHAEVFARRGFLLYLYENIEKALKKQSSIFIYKCGKFELKEGVNFAFYSSQLPCGDASIRTKFECEEVVGNVIQSRKHKLQNSDQTEPKKFKFANDIHRTGAKCLPGYEQDTKEPGPKYHVTGLVRTKPGRGDRSLSVSCSDKMARWIHMGIQGSLLSLLCDSIYINLYIFGEGAPYSDESLQRAFLNRSLDSSLKPDVIPTFYKSSLKFQSARLQTDIRPAPASIVWVKLSNPLCEVATKGRKLGTAKKHNKKQSLCISKYNMYKRFTDTLRKSDELKQMILNDVDVDSVPYNEMKRKAIEYQEKWLEVKEKFFKIWTVKPDMWDFCIKST